MLMEKLHTVALTGVGGTALLLAAKRGCKQAVLLLIEAQADIDVQNKAGGTALMWASLSAQPAIVKLLLEGKANTVMVDCK